MLRGLLDQPVKVFNGHLREGGREGGKGGGKD